MAAAEGQGPSLAWLFFGWSGRLSRVPFALGWAFWLMLLSAALSRMVLVPEDDPSFGLCLAVFFGVGLVSTVSSIMLTIKRLHDMNLPVPLIICLFIPAISFFALIAFLVWPGTPGANDYGRLPDRPKE